MYNYKILFFYFNNFSCNTVTDCYNIQLKTNFLFQTENLFLFTVVIIISFPSHQYSIAILLNLTDEKSSLFLLMDFSDKK